MKIKIVFALLLIFLTISFVLGNIYWAIVIAAAKGLLLGFYFMELSKAHIFWKGIFTLIIGTTSLILLVVLKH